MSDSPTAAPPISVLVIEDVMDTADSLARFLRVGAGLDVRVAYNGEAGVKLAFADPPAAVVCDIGLPRLNGLKVAGELAELKPRPLLIAVTAYGGVYTEDLARAAGFDHYLVKPADPFEIERLILEHGRKGSEG
jgi:DNA-binding response OmpR family regulator